MALHVNNALMITLNPGSWRAISEALLATSVASSTGTPIPFFFQTRSVIDTISNHSTDVLPLLQPLYNFIFVFYNIKKMC
ncbi:hypothetical protein ACFXTH_000050 [Malus domestica]